MAKKLVKKSKKISKPAKAGKLTKAGKIIKPIGVVTHFYGHIKVAIVKFKQPVKVGAAIVIRGNHKDVEQKITSMQYDHKPISLAKKGKEVGIKVARKVKEGDEIFLN